MKTLRFLLLLGSLPLSCPLLYKTNYCSSDQQPTSSLLAAGYFHTCATSSNSTAPTSGQRPIACWGWQEFGQCLTPAGLSDVVLVAAGARHSCAANKEETAKCWGSNVYGQLDLPKPVKSKACVYCKLGEFDSDPLSKNYRYCVVKTPTGSDVYPPLCFFDCILSDSPGLIQSYTPTNVSSTSLTGLRFRLDGQFMCLPLAISAGCHHTCVLYGSAGCTNCNSGFLRCYGSNSHNQSLVPSCPPNLTVTPAVEQLDGSSRLVCPDGSPPLVWLQVSAGMFHTCALTALHRIVCWGSDEYGQSRAPEGLKFKKVSAGAYHSCGITTGGEMLCWGNNQYRQAMSQKDLVTVSNASNPSQSLLAQGGSFIDVACGASHTCAIFLPSGRTLLATQGKGPRPFPAARLLILCRLQGHGGGGGVLGVKLQRAARSTTAGSRVRHLCLCGLAALLRHQPLRPAGRLLGREV
mmetsp:Transcript_45261/g.142467  ORF Transcript_45261/g.142467 Transcript_45261/m.142467 type:complete len:464 (-) Transcript_45261:178-1569(-)